MCHFRILIWPKNKSRKKRRFFPKPPTCMSFFSSHLHVCVSVFLKPTCVCGGFSLATSVSPHIPWSNFASWRFFKHFSIPVFQVTSCPHFFSSHFLLPCPHVLKKSHFVSLFFKLTFSCSPMTLSIYTVCTLEAVSRVLACFHQNSFQLSCAVAITFSRYTRGGPKGKCTQGTQHKRREHLMKSAPKYQVHSGARNNVREYLRTRHLWRLSGDKASGIQSTTNQSRSFGGIMSLE